MPTLSFLAEGHAWGDAKRELARDPAQSETPYMSIDSMHENRETPAEPAALPGAGRSEKAEGPKSGWETVGESDCGIVPMNRPNEAAVAAEEVEEGRTQTKENAQEPRTVRTQSRVAVSPGLEGVREAARKSKQTKFTALLHHLTVALLRDSYYTLQRTAAPGVDGVRWKEYEKGLEEKLTDLHNRVHLGTYRAQPSKRTYIPKADGRQRPLGIAALEDKIVQQAVVTILNAVYEEDFMGFSYGFRPGRGCHMALDALTVGICRKQVNWVLDCDIRGFLDRVNHEWMMRFIGH